MSRKFVALPALNSLGKSAVRFNVREFVQFLWVPEAG